MEVMVSSTSSPCPDDSFGPWAGANCRGGFDFTLLFEECILSIPVDGIFILALLWLVRRRVPQDIKLHHSSSSRMRAAFKLGTALCLSLLRLALLVLWANSSSGLATSKSRASVPAAAVSLVASIAYLFISWQEHEKSVRPSFEIEMYLFFYTLLNLARTRTLWMMKNSATVPALFTACMALQAIGILSESWEKRRVLREPYRLWAAESLGSTFNRSVFFWLNRLLLQGSRSLLTLSDLPPLDTKLESDKLKDDFQAAWDKVPDKTKSGALMNTWLSVHFKYIFSPVIPKLFQIAFTFAQPLIVERAIEFAATPSKPEFNNVGYGLIGAYALVYTGIAISTGQVQWRMVRVTAYMRGAIVPCITKKTLKIDLAQARAASALTLITTDIETIDGGIIGIHDLWASFVEIGLGAYLLWRQIGRAMGIPLGVVFFVVIIAMFLAVPVGSRLAEWIQASEVRVASTSRVLGSVKSYRMAGLNSIVFEAIEKLRIRELQISRNFRLWFSAATILPLSLPMLSPVLSFAGFVGLSNSSGGLTISSALTSLSILALMNRPLNNLSVALPTFAGAVASFGRVQEYLNVNEKKDKRIWAHSVSSPDMRKESTAQESTTTAGKRTEKTNDTEVSNETLAEKGFLPDGVMVAVDTKLTWPGSEKPVLDIQNLAIPSSAVTVLLGPTGCGKSTLLNIILGELTAFEGTIRIASFEISYCAQKTWLPNVTIKQAIVGKLPYDAEWYCRTIQACALSQDFATLAQGDDSLLGSRGTSLSGGQKQRIAIARAIYARNQFYILDDAFKGLDNTTAGIVMHNLLGPQGLLRSSGITSIISASDYRIVHFADHLVMMGEGGTIIFQGLPRESGLEVPANESVAQQQEDKDQLIQEEKTEGYPGGETKDSANVTIEEQDLTRQTGDTKVHKFYARAAGLNPVLIFVGALLVGAFSEAFSQIWVLWWTQAIEDDPNTSTGKWLGVYAALGTVAVLSNLVAAWEIFIVVITKTGLFFHTLLIQTVSKARMSFFNIVDQGVTVNRFSQDIQLIDMELPGSALGAAIALATVLGQIVLIGVTARYIAATFPFIILVFYLIQKFYLRTSRQMRFLDIEHKAPLYTQTIETLDGLASIRAFGLDGGIMSALCKSLDDSQRPMYLLACLQQWLMFTSDMTVAVLAVILITITATLREQIGVGFMGLALSNVVAFSTTVQTLLVAWVQLEISIGAVARMTAFSTSVELEENDETSTGRLSEEWPSKGRVSLRNVSASYPKTGQVLHDINLEIPPGSTVGVCGRTGSGKSSLALSLFKLIDLDRGSILIDDVDIATAAPDQLRNAIVGVPQDFLTLDGTLRFNVDPQRAKSDEEIIEILEKAHLWAALKPRGGLDLSISEDALSYGELQLLGFARAMARRSKVLVLDEVSSSMDETTSAVINELIATWFKDWTIIAVAHKLDSIRNFDKILVLDSGKVVEFDCPDKLLENPSSLFRKLYESNRGQRL